MPSPFPGMDPYLEDEAFWYDFEACFLTYLCDAVSERLPERYFARLRGRPMILDESFSRLPAPEESSENPGSELEDAPEPVAPVELEPAVLPLAIADETRTNHIEIQLVEDCQVMTVLELLSPPKKSGGDRHVYLQRRNALLREDINLFELDLLLGGNRLPLAAPLPPGDYYAFLSRANRRPNCEVFAWPIRRPLPALPIPLKAPDPDVVIPFAELFQTAYNRGRYERALAYNRPPPGPVSDADRAWVEERAATMVRGT